MVQFISLLTLFETPCRWKLWCSDLNYFQTSYTSLWCNFSLCRNEADDSVAIKNYFSNLMHKLTNNKEQNFIAADRRSYEEKEKRKEVTNHDTRWDGVKLEMHFREMHNSKFADWQKKLSLKSSIDKQRLNRNTDHRWPQTVLIIFSLAWKTGIFRSFRSFISCQLCTFSKRVIEELVFRHDFLDHYNNV